MEISGIYKITLISFSEHLKIQTNYKFIHSTKPGPFVEIRQGPCFSMKTRINDGILYNSEN